ncbi:amidohydrolase family protein [Streptomyces sp. AC495_CC817]|uniref:N-acyl-D-amino-acid deacylase family protein n=1 Tax=Streptomyces sp. AC495_CC817 TaxID=2823900 RepID=UPI001C270E6F|nr:D-aminoacylase [Streptomyces sp. AC495_CC817]
MHDLIISGGEVHDGFGSPAVTADVAVTAGRVVAVGAGLGSAARTIDASGLVVAPGFVDPHSHSDWVPFLPEAQPFKLVQGVTTEIVGNCGFSPAPVDPATADLAPISLGGQSFPRFSEYLDAVEAAGTTNHLAAMVGHNTLRVSTAGMDRVATAGAVERMCALAAEAFEAGAVGFSTGLEYVPGAYATQEELAALARVARRFDGTYTTHMRSESEGLEAALDEAIAVARSAGIRLQVSHCKASGPAAHGMAETILGRIAAARRSGLDVRGDLYPYQAFATTMVAMLPTQACEGGVDDMLARLRDPDTRAALLDIALGPDGTGVGLWREVRPEDLQVLTHSDETLVGRRLSEVLDGRTPWDALCDILIADPDSFTVCHTLDEADLLAIMADPLIAIGSDSGMPALPTHPRTFGTFPTFLGEYVRERGVVALPEAIRKVTSATASQFGLSDRGWLGEGAAADIVVFDAATIGHTGDYATPDVSPTGMVHVLLEGEPVIVDGVFTGARRGRMLRRGR